MSERFFLSYRRDDVAGHVGPLKQRLAQRFGSDAVIDSSQAVTPGSDYRTAIESAIKGCDSVIVLIGPGWLSATDASGRRRLDDADDLVRQEIRAALAARRWVIPVLVDGARMPSTDQLPADIAQLARFQAIEINSSQLEEVLFRSAPTAAESVPTAARPSSTPSIQAPQEWSDGKRTGAAPGAPRGMPGGGLADATIGMIAAALKAAGRLVGSLAPSGRGAPGNEPEPPSDRTGAPTPPAPPLRSEPVLLGVTAPRSCLPGGQFNAVLAAYVEAARASAQAKLERIGGAGAMPLMDIPPDRQSGWIVGAPVTVRVTASHADVEPAERSFEWNGRENLAAFTVRVHDNAPGAELDLCFHVALANVPIASIPMPVALGARAANETPRVESIRTARSAFASYSSKDAQTVGYCLSSLTRWSPDLAIFQDCLDLKANESFKPQLANQIRASDVFMLFWSRNASSSPWVRWEYDTARQAKGIAAVIPMPLEDPKIAPPPQEFDDAHMRDRFMVARYALAKIDEVAADG